MWGSPRGFFGNMVTFAKAGMEQGNKKKLQIRGRKCEK